MQTDLNFRNIVRSCKLKIILFKLSIIYSQFEEVYAYYFFPMQHFIEKKILTKTRTYESLNYSRRIATKLPTAANLRANSSLTVSNRVENCVSI